MNEKESKTHLKWNNRIASFTNLLDKIYMKELFSDATISCQGKFYPVHQIVLSASSTYFKELFQQCINLNNKHYPLIIVPTDIKPYIMEALLNYIYKGEMIVTQEILSELTKAAQIFQINSLYLPDEEYSTTKNQSSSIHNVESPNPKKQRISIETKFNENMTDHNNASDIPVLHERNSTKISSKNNVTADQLSNQQSFIKNDIVYGGHDKETTAFENSQEYFCLVKNEDDLDIIHEEFNLDSDTQIFENAKDSIEEDQHLISHSTVPLLKPCKNGLIKCVLTMSSESSLENHIVEEHPNKYACPSCSITYVFEANLAAHIKEEHSNKIHLEKETCSNKENTLKCSQRLSIASSTTSLDQHMDEDYKNHSLVKEINGSLEIIDQNIKYDDSPSKLKENSSHETMSHEKTVWSLHLPNESTTENHEDKPKCDVPLIENILPQAAVKKEDSNDDSSSTAETIYSNWKRKESSEFTCTECSYKTMHKFEILQHWIAQHLKCKSFICTLCSFTETSKIDMDMHVEEKHSCKRKRVTECSMCSFSANSKELITHYEKEHCEEETKFKYPFCSQRYTVRTDSRKHIRTSNEKQFKCSYCSYSSVRKNNIDQHEERMHLKDR